MVPKLIMIETSPQTLLEEYKLPSMKVLPLDDIEHELDESCQGRPCHLNLVDVFMHLRDSPDDEPPSPPVIRHSLSHPPIATRASSDPSGSRRSLNLNRSTSRRHSHAEYNHILFDKKSMDLEPVVKR